jgi:hypothetical protein
MLDVLTTIFTAIDGYEMISTLIVLVTLLIAFTPFFLKLNKNSADRFIPLAQAVLCTITALLIALRFYPTLKRLFATYTPEQQAFAAPLLTMFFSIFTIACFVLLPSIIRLLQSKIHCLFQPWNDLNKKSLQIIIKVKTSVEIPAIALMTLIVTILLATILATPAHLDKAMKSFASIESDQQTKISVAVQEELERNKRLSCNLLMEVYGIGELVRLRNEKFGDHQKKLMTLDKRVSHKFSQIGSKPGDSEQQMKQTCIENLMTKVDVIALHGDIVNLIGLSAIKTRLNLSPPIWVNHKTNSEIKVEQDTALADHISKIACDGLFYGVCNAPRSFVSRLELPLVYLKTGASQDVLTGMVLLAELLAFISIIAFTLLGNRGHQ